MRESCTRNINALRVKGVINYSSTNTCSKIRAKEKPTPLSGDAHELNIKRSIGRRVTVSKGRSEYD